MYEHHSEPILSLQQFLGRVARHEEPHGPEARLFAACFALYGGIVLVGAAGILVAPFLHRMLHRLHRAR